LSTSITGDDVVEVPSRNALERGHHEPECLRSPGGRRDNPRAVSLGKGWQETAAEARGLGRSGHVDHAVYVAQAAELTVSDARIDAAGIVGA
jgi:hypothetical protein